MQIYTKQFFDPRSDIVESEEATEASNLFVKEAAVIVSKRNVNSWTVPARHVAVQKFTVYSIFTLHFLLEIVQGCSII